MTTTVTHLRAVYAELDEDDPMPPPPPHIVALFRRPVRPTARLELDRDELLLLVESLENRTDDATREEADLVCKLLNAIEDIANKEDR